LLKVDPRLSLEGACTPEMLRALVEARGEEPVPSADEVRARFAPASREELAKAAAWRNGFFRTAEHFEALGHAVARAMLEDLVIHADLHVDALAHESSVLDLEALVTAINDGFDRATRDPDDAYVSWSLVIALGDEPARALDLVERLAKMQLQHVVGVALDADRCRPAAFKPALDRARDADLKRVVRAGLQGGAKQVREVLDVGADRISGGVHLTEDPAVTAHLRAHRMPVEVCLSAAVQAGVVKDHVHFPIARLREAGLYFVVGTDAPGTLGTTLTRELELMSKHHAWRLDDVRNAMKRAVDIAFLPPELRSGLMHRVESWRHRPIAV